MMGFPAMASTANAGSTRANLDTRWNCFIGVTLRRIRLRDVRLNEQEVLLGGRTNLPWGLFQRKVKQCQ